MKIVKATNELPPALVLDQVRERRALRMRETAAKEVRATEVQVQEVAEEGPLPRGRTERSSPLKMKKMPPSRGET